MNRGTTALWMLLGTLGATTACSSSSGAGSPSASAGAAGAATGGRAGTGGATSRAGAGGASASPGGSSGSAGTSSGSAGGSSGSAGTSSGSAGAPGGAGSAGTCPPAMATTITNVTNGTVPLSATVSWSGVVATSPKFLASKGSKGACQWGIFVSEPIAQAVPYSGALVMTNGARAVADSTGAFGPCPGGSDPIPDDAKPGDVFNVTASVISYVKASCATSTTPPPAAEVRAGDACAVTRTGTGHAVPTPAMVPTVTELTNSATEATHRKWTGVLVQLQNVAGVDIAGGGPVGATGTIQLANGVRVRDRIYQPKTASYGAMTTFSSIVGISHLDVCTWAVEPRDPCTDLSPKSQGCP